MLSSNYTDTELFKLYTWFELIVWCIFISFAIYSITVARQKLAQPGVSRKVRQLIVKRHVSYMVCYFICNLFILMNRIHILIDLKGTREKVSTFYVCFSAIFEILFYL